MARGTMTSFGFPPFTRAVKMLIIANVAVFVLMLLFRLTVPSLEAYAGYFYLSPSAVIHGFLWQLFTYSFFHATLGHLLVNMFGLWMFGSQFEMDFGTRRFWEFYFWCVVGAALTTIAVGALGLLGMQLLPIPLFRIMANIWYSSTLGASGGGYGLLIAFGILNGDRIIHLIIPPIPIKARYIAAIFLFISFVNAFSGANGVAEFAHLGGALFGWLYLRFIPRYGLQTAASEGLFGIRNRYYKWKRRRAAKKFEVFMRRNKADGYFDKHGNYRGSSLDKKDDDEKWIN